MNQKGLTIRSKLLLVTGAVLFFWVVIALFYVDASNRLKSQQELFDVHRGLQGDFFSLQHTFSRMVQEQQPGLRADCIGLVHIMEDRLRQIGLHGSVEKEAPVRERTERLRDALDDLANHLRADAETGASTDLLVVGDLMESLSQALEEHQIRLRRDRHLQISLALALGFLAMGILLALFSIRLTGAFSKLKHFSRLLKSGVIPPPLEFPSGDEFGQIAADLNSHVSELRRKISYITSSASGEATPPLETGEHDELGNALVVLADYMARKELEEATRNRTDKKQHWIAEGHARLGEILRSEREDLHELCFRIIQKMVSYMRVEMGSLFVTGDSDPEHPSLELAACYAYDRRKYLSRTLAWGEGLPGTCALEKERIFLTEVPQDYFEITSGIGAARPNCILLVPLRIGEEVHGVIELATVRLLKPHEIEFVESLSESIASSLLAVRSSQKTALLLEQSRAQAEALKIQEATMLENMNQLELAHDESRRKESEITGILNAINSSSLVAEMSPSGRFTGINDRFLQLLETHKDQVVGKHHSEFAEVDAYSDAYKKFWSDLGGGTPVSKTEKYKLFSDREVWLEQTFTPIVNSEGKVDRILNIATDITEIRELRDQLEMTESEITRRTLDMQTLNQAVNASLIKCELDPDGIIMDVNENYSEVTGYSRKELLGRNYRLFLKDLEKEQFEKIWEQVSLQKVYEGVMRRSKPTGEEVWLVSTFSPVKDETGVIYKVYYMGLDITEKKQKYQLLEDANREIERLKEKLKEYEA
ncbi:MAG TPA: PAS domain S-box protein [Bacteroides sp.]|nr:PAS domain S-box protein [Bacteroides sp.]